MVPPERVNTDTYSFLHANNNMWLEILKDGTVKTNTCPTKFGKKLAFILFFLISFHASLHVLGTSVSSKLLCSWLFFMPVYMTSEIQ